MQAAYEALGRLLQQLNVKTLPDKTVAPTQKTEFLGTWFDTETGMMEVTEDRMQDLIKELYTWSGKTAATRKEAEQLAGKLRFICNVVKAG